MILSNVRFGSEPDICAATNDIRYAPNSDRESGHPQKAIPLDCFLNRGREWRGGCAS